MPTMQGKLTVTWLDAGRKARMPSSPKMPNGFDADMSQGAAETCTVELPYPAPQCGSHLVECSACGWRGIITAAGRADDPRSVKVPCKAR